MDDMQWFAPNQDNLEKILTIALNGIQVNKEKSGLLIIKPKIGRSKTTRLDSKFT